MAFFTLPASQRKRKRTENSAGPSRKKPDLSRPRREREDSISGSDAYDSENDAAEDQGSAEEEEEMMESSDEGETAAERRLKLAERYLNNIRQEIDEVGFDAEQIDKDLIAERLKEDVAESKGLIYRPIADNLDFSSASHTFFRLDTLSTTGIATCPPYAYTVSKDRTLVKWELARPPRASKNSSRPQPRQRTRPKKLCSVHGVAREASSTHQNHTAPILCVSASNSGKFVATGGQDGRIIVWLAKNLTPLRVFTHHRDAVLSLAFRLNSNQLFSASRDRTLKSWNCDELAYVETLFGHQDEVVDVQALHQETCFSVGARDRTARLWKVVEESQLIFRGGSHSDVTTSNNASRLKTQPPPPEDSIDRITVLTPTLFVTGSSSGSLSLWTTTRKKPICVIPSAHGLEPPPSAAEMSAEQDADPANVYIPPAQPRWITALAAVPGSDLVISGSWDGWIRAWKVVDGQIEGKKGVRKRLEAIGTVGSVIPALRNKSAEDPDENKSASAEQLVKGFINDLSVFERGERGQDGLCIVAAVGKEHRLGRWKKIKSGKNGAVVFEVPKLK